MTQTATGTFVVQLKPLAAYDTTEGTTAGRLSIDKQFSGDLEGVSKGEMLSAGAPATGSAGYVAIETVRGRLHGREGTFALQHSGMMDGGVPSLTIHVVPASGTGELAGIRGTMSLDFSGGGHAYTLEYTLGD